MTFVLSSTDEILVAIGLRLREQRLAQKLGQEELAQMAGLSVGAVKKLESSGKTSLETLIKVVQTLGLSQELDNLFTLQRQSIADMELAFKAKQRKRAPRKPRA